MYNKLKVTVQFAWEEDEQLICGSLPEKKQNWQKLIFFSNFTNF